VYVGDGRCTMEVAGIGYDASLLRFARQHLQAVYAWPLGGSFVFSLGAWQGPYAEQWTFANQASNGHGHN
jgi:hypothetical protein